MISSSQFGWLQEFSRQLSQFLDREWSASVLEEEWLIRLAWLGLAGLTGSGGSGPPFTCYTQHKVPTCKAT